MALNPDENRKMDTLEDLSLGEAVELSRDTHG
jgi:hypothetical protein